MLKRTSLIIIVVVIVAMAGDWLYQSRDISPTFVFDPKNASYTVEGDAIATVWGEPSLGDLNADKVE